MSESRPRRVFLGLHEIAGYYAGLQRGFESLGVPTTYVDLSNHPFAYSAARSGNLLVRAAEAAGRRRAAVPRDRRLPKVGWVLLGRLLGIPLLLWALARHDAFVFSWSSRFVGLHELALFRLLRKRVVFVFHGSDSRPPYLDGNRITRARIRSPGDAVRLTKLRKRDVATIERYADALVAYPLDTHLHRRPVVSFFALGVPAPEVPDTGAAQDTSGPGVRIVHAPSDPLGKGSDLIREAVRELEAKGLAITYVELTALGNDAVLDEIRRADLVIDQAYSPVPMAGLATEAACLGKPSLVAGYAGAELPHLFPWGEVPPVCYVHPAQVAEGAERLVVDADLRHDLGTRARRFVLANWTAARVAERYLRVLAGDSPREWLYDPAELRYVGGYGLPEDEVKHGIRDVVEAGGESALAVDNPELRQRLVEFAYS